MDVDTILYYTILSIEEGFIYIKLLHTSTIGRDDVQELLLVDR